MSTPKEGGDDLLREKGGVGEGRAARPSERPGVGGGARPDWRSVLEVGRHRQEGRGRRTPSRATTPSAGGRGALRAHTAGQRHPAQEGGVALALARQGHGRDPAATGGVGGGGRRRQGA